jgi:hypothetical protein
MPCGLMCLESITRGAIWDGLVMSSPAASAVPPVAAVSARAATTSYGENRRDLNVDMVWRTCSAVPPT